MDQYVDGSFEGCVARLVHDGLKSYVVNPWETYLNDPACKASDCLRTQVDIFMRVFVFGCLVIALVIAFVVFLKTFIGAIINGDLDIILGLFCRILGQYEGWN